MILFLKFVYSWVLFLLLERLSLGPLRMLSTCFTNDLGPRFLTLELRSLWALGETCLLGSLDFSLCTAGWRFGAHFDAQGCSGRKRTQHCMAVPAGCSTLDPSNRSLPAQKAWSAHWLNIYHQMWTFIIRCLTLKPLWGPRSSGGKCIWNGLSVGNQNSFSLSSKLSPVHLSRSLPPPVYLGNSWDLHLKVRDLFWCCN